MHERAERVHTSNGRLVDTANSASKLGGRLQVTDIHPQHYELWKRGGFIRNVFATFCGVPEGC